MNNVIFNINLAFNAILSNKTRAMLTALGIIFGVAAVISMLAIGQGAQFEIMNQIKLVGVNNIVIDAVVNDEQETPSVKGKMENQKYSPGLSLKDAKSVVQVIPSVQMVSPEVVHKTFAVRSGKIHDVKLVGVTGSFFNLYDFELNQGSVFNEYHLTGGKPVCIIGNAIKTQFFNREDPINKWIKCGDVWLKIIGVLEKKNISDQAIQNLNIRDYNQDIYTPVQTMLVRFKNRSLISNLKQTYSEEEEEVKKKQPDKNYHQLDKLVVQVKKTSMLASTTEIISRMLKRKHFGIQDFEITVPELLLKQQQKTKDIFNIVLGAIAGISLVVGGIGIMNIMLASVMERIKEIGIRMAVGARKEDIISQFLTESVLISMTGGIIGVLFGVSFAILIEEFFDIKTIITFSSIIISFGVSASVGLIFGIMPAKKAAGQDPVVSLRHE